MKKLKLNALELGAKEVLTRAQLKNVLGGTGGSGGGCSASATCFTTTYNPQTHEWEQHPNGSISCSGVTNCTESTGHVSCQQENGTYSTGSC